MDRRQCLYLFLGFCIFLSVIYLSSLHQVSRSFYLTGENSLAGAMMKKPNFVFILTDDQDSILGSMNVMKSVQQNIISVGATFTNSFVVSPLCCPSRSSILTGQYVHNHKAVNNSLDGGCSSRYWQNGPEKKSFANTLHQNGYQTFFAGKYLNRYGMKEAGGLSHIPPGWDWWIGLEGNSKYYNYSLSVNGTREEHGNNPLEDYLTNVITRRALEFLNERVLSQRPFFMMLSTPACHAPFDAEPKYVNNFSGQIAPRTKNFNVANDKSKHWLLRLGEQPLSKEILEQIDEVYRKRLRTLLSVDDMVKMVASRLQELKLLDSTYIIFTSDNGYHLGQFSLPLDKREPYESDIRVPFYIRGPGIHHSAIDYPITNIDLAPSILDLAGISIPKQYDGISIKSIFQSLELSKSESQLLRKTYSFPFHVANIFEQSDSVATFRKTLLIEHSGEGHPINYGCEYLGSNLAGCNPQFACKCEDAKNNTYSCIRHIGKDENFVFCSWNDEENFHEVYDLKQDADQLNNTINFLSPKRLKRLQYSLNNLKKCRGTKCAKLSQFVF